jgi:hypothetical protein
VLAFSNVRYNQGLSDEAFAERSRTWPRKLRSPVALDTPEIEVCLVLLIQMTSTSVVSIGGSGHAGFFMRVATIAEGRSRTAPTQDGAGG